LNLTLRVGRRREDGFHEIVSVAAKVTLYDEILLRRRPGGRLRLECAGLDCGPPEENLVLRAAECLSGRGPSRGADIVLTKRIPPAAGLGGGSSDAAATLLGLNRLWELGLSRAAIAERAAELGSDVPLFLNGPAVRIGGRGERVRPAEVHPFHAVLYLPPVTCLTAAVYASRDAVAAEAEPPPAVEADDFAAPPSQWRLFNDLRAPAERLCPPLAAEAKTLASATGRQVHMTGSGSGLFVLADDGPRARALAEALPEPVRDRCRIVALNPW